MRLLVRGPRALETAGAGARSTLDTWCGGPEHLRLLVWGPGALETTGVGAQSSGGLALCRGEVPAGRISGHNIPVIKIGQDYKDQSP